MNKPKVNFLCIGTQKGGTTSLQKYLCACKGVPNDIYFNKKELHFFNSTDLTEESISEYEKNFDPKENHTLIGEKTPEYCFPYAIDRIYEYNPNMKLLFFLREPISRCFSEVNMNNQKFDIDMDDLFKWLANADDGKTITDVNGMSAFYNLRGFYDEFIEYIYTKFPKENVYIGISEEIKKNKDKEYKKIFDFLGCNYDKNIDINTWDIEDLHVREYTTEMPERVRKDLYNLYKPHNENLYKILGRRIEVWEEKYIDIINEQKQLLSNEIQLMKNTPVGEIKKNIFIFWNSGFENANDLIKLCLKINLKKWSSEYNIVQLSEKNVHEYFPYYNLIKYNTTLDIQPAHISDFMRTYLICKYGGIWIDASCIINNLNENLMNKQSYYVKFQNAPNRQIMNWFIYAKPNCNELLFVLEKLYYYLFKNRNKKLIVNRKHPDYLPDWNFINSLDEEGYYPYFFYHYLFYIYSKEVKLIEYVKNNHQIDKMNIMKFDRRTVDVKDILEFIHIGKTGGTSITNYLKHHTGSDIREYHLSNIYTSNTFKIIWIRNPISRFVSAFNYQKSIVNTDITLLDKNNLNLDNCLAPQRISNKFNTGYFYNERFDWLMNYFQSANELAESLTSENIEINKIALELMNSDIEHLYKSIGWYLYDGYIQKNHWNILFVGTKETMDKDIKDLNLLLSINNNNNISKKRENHSSYDKYLSKKAMNNIINFYENSDYRALKELVKYDLISSDTLKSYYTYKFTK